MFDRKRKYQNGRQLVKALNLAIDNGNTPSRSGFKICSLLWSHPHVLSWKDFLFVSLSMNFKVRTVCTNTLTVLLSDIHFKDVYGVKLFKKKKFIQVANK